METDKGFYVSLYPVKFFTDERWLLMNSAERGLYWTICLHLYTNGGKWRVAIDDLKKLSNWPTDDSSFDTSLIIVNQSFKIYCRSSKITYQHTFVSKQINKAQTAYKQKVTAAKSRWNKDDPDDAGAMRPHCGRNAIRIESNRSDKNRKEKSESNTYSIEFLKRYDWISKQLKITKKGDKTTLKRIINYIFSVIPEEQDPETIWNQIAKIAIQSLSAVKPMAYFTQSIKTNYGDYHNACINEA